MDEITNGQRAHLSPTETGQNKEFSQQRVVLVQLSLKRQRIREVLILERTVRLVGLDGTLG